MAFAEQTLCSCYDFYNISCIESYVYEYKETARRKFLDSLPPYREKWESKYHSKFKELNSKFYPKPKRYPEFYHNILLYSQQIDLVKDYQLQAAYEQYMKPGWAYSKSEKKVRIEKERNRFIKYAQVCQQKLEECTTEIINEYIKLYEACLKKHNCFATYHDFGLLTYLNRNFDKSLDLLYKMIEQAENLGELENINATVYHNLGSVCIESMIYDKAIDYLTKSIKKDPGNKKVYFDRAIAYFETGSFDLALEDYLLSNKGNELTKSTYEATIEFSKALFKSVCQGAAEATCDFVPSLCSSAFGISETLWAINPLNPESLENAGYFANACYEMAEVIADYYKNVDWNTLENYVDQIRDLCTNFNNLNEAEKAELIGYTIGRYGVDLFASGAFVKSISAYRNLCNANKLCTLESMLVSKKNKEAVISSSLKHAKEREQFFKNVTIEWDKQNKHIIGKHNYVDGKSVFEHQHPNDLISKFAGKGKPANKEIPGSHGYKELVDFGEHIGIWKDIDGIYSLPTKKGHIHYSKKGAHIVPAHPE